MGISTGVIPILIGVLIITVTYLIRAEFAQKKKQIYFLKPVSTLTIVAIIVLSFFMNDIPVPYKSAILLGMIFCLGGDIALMFESQKAFMSGLILFLLGHVVYTIAFIVANGFLFDDFKVTAVVTVISGLLYWYLYPALGKMRGPVFAYVVIISLMLNSAWLSFNSSFFDYYQARYLAIGASLFYISDVILAINRFKIQFTLNRISLAFYFFGQLLIALSVHHAI